ncbi:hypothetical protein GRI33_00950 [Brucella sp. BO3]|uniref:hypothetical protein n=1 Tax=Brucella TaxID=234 RepID=UPI00084F904C|nr:MULTISPECIES: hypothetical protein [Brucella]OEI84424.1 hypothetical protein BA060_03815 [Brucella sp. B13-0095]QMV25581.1 hypothetical protein GRI33_00950 [Brucella sp. BO3]
MNKFAATIAIVLATGTTANAQWIYQGQESAFDDDALHIAVTAAGQYGFGFRCKGAKIEAVYMTPDKSFEDSAAISLANATKPKIRVRVDKNPVVDVDVELQNINDKATAFGDVDIDLLKSVAAAKNRVAVVMQILGENYHEKSFNVRGSTKSIGQIIKACGLEDDGENPPERDLGDYGAKK